MVYDIIEESFNVQLMDESKTEITDKLIDEAVSFQDKMLVKINGAKTKADFRPILKELEDSAIEFVNKLNGLN